MSKELVVCSIKRTNISPFCEKYELMAMKNFENFIVFFNIDPKTFLDSKGKLIQ
jgi:hypothetical protein